MSESKQTGTIKFFNEAKGYGFIVGDADGLEIFVHANGCQSGIKLKEFDKVSYNVEDTKRGLNAINVEKI